jgi:hypothetical protein
MIIPHISRSSPHSTAIDSYWHSSTPKPQRGSSMSFQSWSNHRNQCMKPTSELSFQSMLLSSRMHVLTLSLFLLRNCISNWIIKYFVLRDCVVFQSSELTAINILPNSHSWSVSAELQWSKLFVTTTTQNKTIFKGCIVVSLGGRVGNVWYTFASSTLSWCVAWVVCVFHMKPNEERVSYTTTQRRNSTLFLVAKYKRWTKERSSITPRLQPFPPFRALFHVEFLSENQSRTLNVYNISMFTPDNERESVRIYIDYSSKRKTGGKN